MDFLDYREALGIAFCDEEKFDYFLKKVFNILNLIEKENFAFGCMNSREYYSFFDSIGELVDIHYSGDDYSLMFSHALSILRKHINNIGDFLSYYISLANSFEIEKEDPDFWTRKNFINCLTSKLEEAHIPYDLLEDDNQQFFVFPKGAKEFDNALVSQPLEWLKDYPKSHKTYCTALKQYADGVYIRDVADNLRKTLESFLQEFLNNNKNLETNKNEICKYLGSQNVDAGISGLFQPLISAYKNVNDRIAKHNDLVDKNLLEFLLYQTGVLIRMVLTVKEAEMEG